MAMHSVDPRATLHGWREIAAYMRRSQRQLSRYRYTEGLPVMKLGRNMASATSLLDRWILAKAEQQAEQRARRVMLNGATRISVALETSAQMRSRARQARPPQGKKPAKTKRVTCQPKLT